MNAKLFLPVVLAIFTSCGHRVVQPELGTIYNAAAKQSHVDRNPIIVIPGILGSKLVEDGQVVWGSFGEGAVDHRSPAGMRSMALPMSGKGWPRDGVRPDGVLSEVELAWGLKFRFKAYAGMLSAFGAGGYLDPELGGLESIDYGKEHFTCFQFAYDWRRSCAENAARLGEFIEEKGRYVARERKRLYGSTAPVKFDICTHSMGGLIARYYLMYGKSPLSPDGNMPVSWAGARHVEKLIVVGTPNGGSAYAYQQLQYGLKLHSLLPQFEPAVIGTMPCVYELLPPESDTALIDEHSRPIPYYDIAEWERRGWGLLDPENDADLAVLLPEVSDPAERQKQARDHLAKMLGNARAFHRAMNRKTSLPGGLEFHSFAGDAESTASRLQVSAGGEMQLIDWLPGDGNVTRASLLRDLRKPSEAGQRLRSPIPWTSSHFIFTDHFKMTSDPAFVDNVLHLLLERPR